MGKQTKMYLVFVLAILFVTTACNFPFIFGTGKAQPQEESTPGEGGLFGGGEEAATPTATVDPKPVGIQEGLGNLNSYRMHFTINTSSSDGKYTNIEEFLIRYVEEENSYTRTIITSFDPTSDSEESTSTEEVYNVGLVTCTGSEADGWTYSDTTDQSKELTNIFKGMVDIVPIIDDPQYVGEETINGVETNHFTFQVQGIGAKSGAQATVNSGEYWLAVDGNYIVKYTLSLEVHSANAESGEDEWSKMDVTFDVTDIDAVVEEIVLPTNCVKE